MSGRKKEKKEEHKREERRSLHLDDQGEEFIPESTLSPNPDVPRLGVSLAQLEIDNRPPDPRSSLEIISALNLNPVKMEDDKPTMENIFKMLKSLGEKVDKTKKNPAEKELKFLERIERLVEAKENKAAILEIGEKKKLLNLAVVYGWGPCYKVAREAGKKVEELPKLVDEHPDLKNKLATLSAQKAEKKSRRRQWKSQSSYKSGAKKD